MKRVVAFIIPGIIVLLAVAVIIFLSQNVSENNGCCSCCNPGDEACIDNLDMCCPCN